MRQKEQDYLEVLIHRWAKWIYTENLPQWVRDDILFLKNLLVDGPICEDDRNFIRNVVLGTNFSISQNIENMTVLAGWHLACAVYGKMNGANYEDDVAEAEKLIQAHELERFKNKAAETRKDFERSAGAMMELYPDRADDIYRTVMKLFDIIDR